MPDIPALYKDKLTGKLNIDSVKLAYKPFFLTPDNDTDGILSLAAVAGDTERSPATVSQEGPEQIYALIMDTDRFQAFEDFGVLVTITDSGSGKDLMNRAVHANTIFGTAEFPMVLPEKMFLNMKRSLTVSVQNIYAYEQDVRVIFDGRRIYTTRADSSMVNNKVAALMNRSVGTMPYFLTTEEDIELAGDASNTFYFPTEADGWFQCFKIAAVAYDTDDDKPNMHGEFNIVIHDGEDRKQLHTGTLSDALVTGTGQTPFILPESWLIEPNKRISVEVTNTTPNSHAATIYMTLIGRKIYVD